MKAVDLGRKTLYKKAVSGDTAFLYGPIWLYTLLQQSTIQHQSKRYVNPLCIIYRLRQNRQRPFILVNNI